MLGELFPLHLNKPAVGTLQHFSFSFKSFKRSATSVTFIYLIVSITVVCVSAEKQHSSVAIVTPLPLLCSQNE